MLPPRCGLGSRLVVFKFVGIGGMLIVRFFSGVFAQNRFLVSRESVKNRLMGLGCGMRKSESALMLRTQLSITEILRRSNIRSCRVVREYSYRGNISLIRHSMSNKHDSVSLPQYILRGFMQERGMASRSHYVKLGLEIGKDETRKPRNSNSVKLVVSFSIFPRLADWKTSCRKAE
jgi:hypothetical protein